MRKTLAKWLVVGALAGFGLVVGAEVAAAQSPTPTPTPDATVQNDNTAEESEAGSGDASGSNDASAESGPQAQSSDDGAQGSDFEGDTSATIAQEGDNEAEVNQEGEANSGDAVAGSQVSGVVSEGGSTSVTSSNTSEDAEAESGDATVNNSANVQVGPRTGGAINGVASDFEGDVSAVIAQEGDNDTDVSQSGTSNTGDAVAGGQIAGIVGAGDISVDSTNVAEDPDAETGDSEVDNAAATNAGPIVSGGAAPITGTASSDTSGGSTAAGTGAPSSVSGGSAVLPSTPARSADFEGNVRSAIAQEGDNSVDASQEAESNSGDAVAGGQVTGLVASEAGSISVVNQQASEDADAESGESNSSNAFAAPVTAGPIVAGGAATTGTAGTSDFEGDVDAVIVQEGDNDVETAQDAESNTGDAVAGAQVVGLVAEGGSSDIVLSNVSEDADAETGAGEAVNFNGASLAGPLAVGGGTATGTAGSSDFEGDVSAAIAQEGDNSVDSSQDSEVATGDAVAGAQVVGAVTSEGGDVAIDATNVSEDDEAESGEGVAANVNGALLAGPIDASGTAAPITGVAGTSDFENDVVDVRVAQEGDNDVTSDQSSESASGDAVAGGQVFGVVAAGDVDIVASNTSEDAEADSGESVAVNANVLTFAGPLNVGGAATTGTAGTSDFEGVVVGAGIAQEGDNDAETNQSSESASGDAVAGGQVFGVVASGSVDIVASNTSEDAEAESGESVAGNDVAANLAGPINAGGAATTGTAGTSDFEDVVVLAGIAQEGDNDASNNQSSDAASGDAVAGGQVFGVVSSGAVAIDATNVSEDDEAESGSAEADNDVFATIAGPINAGGAATTGTAGTSDFEDVVALVGIAQEGDNDLETDQSASSASGDAVAGGQVFGVVAAGSVDIVASNVSEDADAESGDSDSDNAVFAALAGPINLGGAATTGTAGTSDFEGVVVDADIAQEGDNSLDLGQNVDTDSGDAVAGGQIFGVVTEAGGDVAIDATNISEDSDSESGDAEGSNSVFAALVGPLDSTGAGATTGTAGTSDFEADVFGVTVAQEGDNDLSASQSLSIDSGDAVSGGQVMGVVASGSVDIVQSNTSEDDESETGTGSGSNAVGFAQIGPFVGPTLFSGPFGAFIA